MDSSVLVGPAAALGLALLFLGLFYTGKILPRNTVPREDYKALLDVTVAQSERLNTVTTALNELVAMVRHAQKNGGL